MKTTKRSKMLLSSIAMLLVALVALGSATFAWYSIQRDVDAKTISIQASTPGGLKISDDGSNWGNSVTFAQADKVLQPSEVTFNGGSTNGVKSIQVSDSDSTASARSGESLVNAPLGQDSYVILKDIYLVNQNSVKGEITCTITPSDTTGASYTALALVDATATTDNDIYAQVSSGSGTGPKDTATIAKFNLNANGSTTAQKHFYVIGYVDGQNSNCTNQNAPNSKIDFTIDFHMDDVA